YIPGVKMYVTSAPPLYGSSREVLFPVPSKSEKLFVYVRDKWTPKSNPTLIQVPGLCSGVKITVLTIFKIYNYGNMCRHCLEENSRRQRVLCPCIAGWFVSYSIKTNR